MKKLTIFLICFMVLSVGFLNGCTETNNPLSDEERRFVGTWGAYSELFNMTILINFYSDRTFTQGEVHRNWEIKEGKLVLTGDNNEGVTSYDYYFSENDTILNLRTLGADVYVAYTKQAD